MRLDEDKLEALRRWALGLQQTAGEESAAAGRAILLLIAEVEQLQIDLEHAREQPSQVGLQPGDEAAASPEEPLTSTLQERVQRAHRLDSDSSPPIRPQPEEESRSGMGTDGATKSRQAWIEALRRRR